MFFDGLATLSSLVELCLVGDGHLPLGVGREIVSQWAVGRYFFDSITKNGSQSVIFRQHNNRFTLSRVVEWSKQQEVAELWANFARNYVQKHKASSAASLQVSNVPADVCSVFELRKCSELNCLFDVKQEKCRWARRGCVWSSCSLPESPSTISQFSQLSASQQLV